VLARVRKDEWRSPERTRQVAKKEVDGCPAFQGQSSRFRRRTWGRRFASMMTDRNTLWPSATICGSIGSGGDISPGFETIAEPKHSALIDTRHSDRDSLADEYQDAMKDFPDL